MERPAEPPCRAADPAAGRAGRRRPLPARHADPRPARASADPAAASAGRPRPRPSWPARARSCRPACARASSTETLAVLRDPTFAPLFGPDSRAEVAIVAEVAASRQGSGPALRLAGKIDRLVARPATTILIVDYKTNRPPPDGRGPGCGGLPAATRRLPAGGAAASSPACVSGPPFCGPTARESWKFRPSMLDAAEQRLWQLEPASLDA